MRCPNETQHPAEHIDMLGLGEYEAPDGLARRYWVCPRCGTEVAVPLAAADS